MVGLMTFSDFRNVDWEMNSSFLRNSKEGKRKKTEKEMEELKRIMERAILSRKGSAMGKITQKKL